VKKVEFSAAETGIAETVATDGPIIRDFVGAEIKVINVSTAANNQGRTVKKVSIASSPNNFHSGAQISPPKERSLPVLLRYNPRARSLTN